MANTNSSLTTQHLTIDKQPIAYVDTGGSALPVLVMVHGWLSHSRVWRYTLAALQVRYRCIAIDLLGYGDSAKPVGGDYSIEAQGRRVLALADALGIERFTLLGHSMGGQISLCIAGQLAPARVIRLIDVAGVTSGRLQPYVRSVVLPRGALAGWFPGLLTLSRALCRVSAIRRFEFSTWGLNGLPDAEWQLDVDMALQPNIQHSMYLSGQAILHTDLTPCLPRITAPTLVIFGTADRVVPLSEGELVAHGVPNCRIVHLAGAGHFPMIERRAEFGAALNEFLTQSEEG